MGYRRRLFTITLLFTRIFWDFRKEFLLSRRIGYSHAQKRMMSAHTNRAKQLYDFAIESGGVFIKLCQFFSTRRDIFPEPYITILAPLQDQVPPIEFSELEPVLVREMEDWRHFFSDISTEPLASASLGQVHLGRLRSGTEVVLKILKPEIHKKIDIDFAILYFVFKFFNRFQAIRQKADLLLLLDEFIRVTGDELNFIREAHVLSIFKEGLRKFPFLHIPEVYEELCSENIIVMEYCQGDKISQVDDWRARNNDPEIIVTRLIDIYMEQFLYLGWVHFDPHPGNILVTSDNNLVLLDFGMSGQVTDATKKGIKRGLRAIVSKDYIGLLDVLDDLGFIRTGYNRYKLLPILEYFFDEVFTTLRLEREALQSVDLSPVVDDLVDMIYRQPITLPVEWAFLGRTIGTLAGIISTLTPNIKVSEELEPYLRKILKSSLPDMLEESAEYLKNYGMRLVNLPLRLSHVVERIERGELRFKIDLDEMEEQVFIVRGVIISTACILSGIFTLLGSYLFYVESKMEQSLVLTGLGSALIIFGIVRRKNRGKDFLKNQIIGS